MGSEEERGTENRLRAAYNEAQLTAVRHKNGPMMVLAGPGSGKTAVITGRTHALIRGGVDPSGILVVTFTRAAAAEMKARFLAKEGTGSTAVTFGTFHGVFYGILKSVFHISGSNILSEEDKLKLIRQIVDHYYRSGEQEAELPVNVIREIGLIKSRQLDLQHYYSGSLPQDVFRKVYRAYEDWKKQNRKIDFDDIMDKCCELLRKRKDILQQWQKKFTYILIDEFQDISPVQYEIVRMLALPENNLFIVGDDDQSIYRFRGASPEIMLGYPKDYPDAKTVTLNRNYRCTPQILSCAGRVIAHNQKRFPKELAAVSPEGAPVVCQTFGHPGEECRQLVEEIRKLSAEGVPWKQIAVLVRTNQGCRTAVEQMMAYQIPFSIGDTPPCLYDHWIAQDVFAYFRLAKGSTSRSDFLRICNRPNRFISRDALMDKQISFELLYDYYEDKDWMCDRIEQLETDLRVIGRVSPYGALQYIRNTVGYEEYLRDYALKRKLKAEELFQIYDELCESARNFKTLEDWEMHIRDYRDNLQQQRSREKNPDSVMISTLHASKGMEYDAVFILDINEGVIPYQKAVLDADLEEERRMFYVGMTRARKHLYLYNVRERYEKKLQPSRFLTEMKEAGRQAERKTRSGRGTGDGL
ncbi:MAG: ATP-dependent helicase [Lachnospiraceae bacterium]|nr:ATP-dependent helicase [Lachnospiraceae bacterium]